MQKTLTYEDVSILGCPINIKLPRSIYTFFYTDASGKIQTHDISSTSYDLALKKFKKSGIKYTSLFDVYLSKQISKN